MNIKVTLRWSAAISIIALAMVGIVLILVAVFYPTPPHAVLWYLEGGKVYRFDTKTRTTDEVALPAKGDVVTAKFSPDGNKIAFTDDEGLKVGDLPQSDYRLLIANEKADSGAITPFIHSFHPIMWSPDEKWLFVDKREWEYSTILIADMQTFQLQPVLHNREQICSHSLSWSPDGRSFANGQLGIGPCSGEGGLIFFDTLSLSSRRTYFEFVPLGDPAQPSGYFEGGTQRVDWSPANDWIAIEQLTDAGSTTKLLLVSPDGSKVKMVTDQGANPLWASDGKTLYYVRDSELYTVDIDSLVSQLIYSFVDSTPTGLSPDDQWLMLINDISWNYDKYGKSISLLDLSNFELVSVTLNDKLSRKYSFVGWQMVP